MSGFWYVNDADAPQVPYSPARPAPLAPGGTWLAFSGPSMGDCALPWVWWSADALARDKQRRDHIKREHAMLKEKRQAQMDAWQAFTSKSVEGKLKIGCGYDELLSLGDSSLGWALAEALGVDELQADLGRVRITIEKLD